MRYLALATGCDGTLSSDGRVSEQAIRALERLRISGRRTILVTGRRLDDLLTVYTCARLFDLVVAENGAIVYDPVSQERTSLAKPPSKSLIQGLQARGVEPLEIGQVLVATLAPHRSAVHDVIWELYSYHYRVRGQGALFPVQPAFSRSLEAQVIGNRNAVMILPAGVNKATGLRYALRELGHSRHEVAGIGDAENDHSFLECCECAVAVSNAAPSIKQIAAFVTAAENSKGVIEMIDELVADDLRQLEGSLSKNLILLGKNTRTVAPCSSHLAATTCSWPFRLRQVYAHYRHH